MRELEPPFHINNLDLTVHVSEHEVQNECVFHLQFSDNRKPLMITVGEKQRGGDRFWTSIPQGRQEEAEQFGKLIAITYPNTYPALLKQCTDKAGD